MERGGEGCGAGANEASCCTVGEGAGGVMGRMAGGE